MSKKKILVIEDEIIIAENTKSILEDLSYEVAGHAMNLSDAIKLIESIDFDIALVDLMLGNKKDGIEISRILKNKKKPFIITSSYSDKETLDEIKSLTPSGYVVKPLKERDLYAAIEIIPTSEKEGDIKHLEGSIFYKEKDLFVRINSKDIEYIKSDGNYVEIFTKEKKHLLRISLDDLLAKLPPDFIRVHRSYAINSSFISAVSTSHINIGKHEIPLSKTYKDDFLKRFEIL